MKKNYTQLILLLAGIFNLLATGCTSSDIPTQPHNGNFSFYIKMPDPITVETKADIGTADEPITVNNVWILQYLTNDNSLFRCLYIDNTSDQITNDGNNLVKVKTPDTQDEKFSDVESRFYIIVNGGEELLNGFNAETVEANKSEEALKKIITFTNYNYQAASTTPPGLLTAGPITYKPTAASSDAETEPTKTDENISDGSETGINDEGTNDGSNGEETPTESTEKVVFITRMYRAYAKVNVNINFQPNNKFPNSSFTVTECTVNNLPSWGSNEDKTIALYTPAITDAGYPTTDKVTESLTFSSSNASDPSFSFYMPENLRGTGQGTSFEDKNKHGNGPGTSGSLEGCTYLTVKGDYKYDNAQSPIKVEYTFYLGGNLTNDYNIERDHLYNLTLNLKGANSADWRVKITDGNVAVFDEVKEINNEVDF